MECATVGWATGRASGLEIAGFLFRRWCLFDWMIEMVLTTGVVRRAKLSQYVTTNTQLF